MNNRKSKPKKRKLCNREESSGPDSSDKEEDLDSNLDVSELFPNLVLCVSLWD